MTSTNGRQVSSTSRNVTWKVRCLEKPRITFLEVSTSSTQLKVLICSMHLNISRSKWITISVQPGIVLLARATPSMSQDRKVPLLCVITLVILVYSSSSVEEHLSVNMKEDSFKSIIQQKK